MRVKFCVLEETQGIHLHTKFHVNVFFVLASGSQKPQFWTHFDIWVGSCTDPLLPMRSNLVRRALEQTHGVRYMPNFVSIGLFLSPSGSDKTQIFPFFWTSAFCGVANCRQSDKVEYGCTTTNQGIKIVYAFMAKSGAQTLTFKSVTNKHTQKLNVFSCPGGRWNPSPTKLGMVIEDREHVLVPLKLLGSDAHFRR